MKNKKVITGISVAKTVSMIGIIIMLVALFSNFLCGFAKDSRTIFVILLCCCTISYINITAHEKKQKK